MATGLSALQAATYDLPCVKCKYLLRGLDETGCCPECGTSIAESKAAHKLALLRREEAKLWLKRWRRHLFGFYTDPPLLVEGRRRLRFIGCGLAGVAIVQICLLMGWPAFPSFPPRGAALMGYKLYAVLGAFYLLSISLITLPLRSPDRTWLRRAARWLLLLTSPSLLAWSMAVVVADHHVPWYAAPRIDALAKWCLIGVHVAAFMLLDHLATLAARLPAFAWVVTFRLYMYVSIFVGFYILAMPTPPRSPSTFFARGVLVIALVWFTVAVFRLSGRRQETPVK